MKKKLLAILSLTPICLFADFDGLQGQTINEENESKLYYSSLPYAIARQGQRAVDSNASVVGFSELEDMVYSVSDQLHLLSTRKEGRIVLENWPLTRWEYHLSYIERIDRLNEYSVNDIGYVSGIKNPLGCLEDTPLKYGDVHNNGSNVLVLTLGNDLIIFSPQYERIVFSASLDLFDWMSENETRYLYEDEQGNYEKPDGEPQFASAIFNTRRLHRENIVGYRGYAKVYEGDFDKDGSVDLLVWQKVYESKLESDNLRGFDKIRNGFYHFERDLDAQAETDAGITGEYLPQDTDEADIKTWLADNDLTWSQGYPSVSECPGEEGQLIPEMHDPLLNDPEVLQ